jgi:uncharacterized membrane protein YphA (DoxX/SURF4 family)
MNTALWVLQIVSALVFGASGVMKLTMLDKMSQEVPSFGALPRGAWKFLGVVELVSVVGLILPSALRWHPTLTAVAAAVLAAETLVFVWVHVKYREVPPIVLSAVLGLVMAFLAFGRAVLEPIS